MAIRQLAWVSLCLIGTLGCNKDDDNPTACEKLEGTWQFQSWTEDGQQIIGDSILVTDATFVFKPLMEGLGDYEWNVHYIIGGDEMVIGAYRPDDQCETVTITPKGGLGVTYDFSFTGGQLVLETTDNGVVTQFILEKE